MSGFTFEGGGPDETATINEQVLKDEDLPELLRYIQDFSHKWYSIGLGLGFTTPELDQIKAMPSLFMTAPTSFLVELLTRWMQWPTINHSTKPTLGVFCSTLRNYVMLESLAKKVETGMNPAGRLTLKVLQDKLGDAHEQWLNIGIELKLSEGDLRVIEENNKGNVMECFNEMIKLWLECGEPSWSDVVDALRAKPVHCLDLAAKIEAEHLNVCRNTSCGQKKRKFEIGKIDEVYAPPLKAIKLVQDISSEEQRPQKEKLEHESRDIMLKFLILRNKFFKSLKDELLDDLVRGLECIKVHVEPIPADSIRQKVSFEDIRKNVKTVEAVKDVIESYSSFYCYEVLATMIESFGTEEDKRQLKNYTDNFKEYARRRVYKCSSITGSTYTSQDSELFIKLDSLYDHCSLHFLKRFHWNLSTLLGISFKTLRLCRIEDGCIELFFAIARFIQEAIFPLTDKQESELRRLHVIRLSCGSYHFMNIAQFDNEDHHDSDSFSDDESDSDSDHGGDGGSSYLSTRDIENSAHAELTKKVGAGTDSGIGTGSKSAHSHSIVISAKELDEPTLDLHSSSFSLSSDNCDALCKASYSGDMTAVKQLVEEKQCSPTQLSKSGGCALHHAAGGGHVIVLKYLADISEEMGYSLAVKGDLCQTPLHTAVQYGRYEVVIYLVCEQKIDPFEQDQYGRTAIHYACIGGDLNILKFLFSEIEKYMPTENIIYEKTKSGFTPLHLSAYYGYEHIVKYLISEKGFNPHTKGRKGRTALHEASENGHEGIINYLIVQCNLDPDSIDDYRYTPLHIAAFNGHLNLVQYLVINHHCTLYSLTVDNFVPLHLATINNRLEIVSFLTSDRVNCDPNVIGPRGKSSFHLAAECGHLSVTKYFAVDLKCSPFFIDDDKLAPVQIADNNCHHVIVKFLNSFYLCQAAYKGDLNYLMKYFERFNCDPNAQCDDGTTALHAACTSGCLSVVEYLVLEQQCNILSENYLKLTPLHLAALNGHLAIVVFLTSPEVRCDPNVHSSNGKTPLDLAVESNHETVIKFLTDKINNISLMNLEFGDFKEILHDSARFQGRLIRIACVTGDLKELKELFEHMNPNQPTEFGDVLTNALFMAVGSGFLPIAKYLIEERKCNVSCVDSRGRSPLHVASECGHTDMVKYLVNEQNCSMECFDAERRSPLSSAALNGHFDIVKYFIEDIKCDPNSSETMRNSLLSFVARYGNVDAVKFILENNYCTASQKHKHTGSTTLHYACRGGNLEVVRLLIEVYKCEPLSLDFQMATPLYWASFYGHCDIVRYYVNKLHFVPKKSMVYQAVCPLQGAAQNGHLHIVKYLIEEAKDEPDNSLIFLASEYGHLDVVKYLLQEKYCDPSCTGIDGQIPLHRAAGCGNLQILKYLVEEEQCPVMATDASLFTPLHFAAQGGKLDVVQYLISVGKCDPTCCSNKGITPLHCAVKGGHLNVVKYLVSHNPLLVQLPDHRDSTPLYTAVASGHLSIVKYLVEEINCSLKESRGNLGDTPLHVASVSGHLNIVKYLIEERKCNPNERNAEFSTSLFMAIGCGHLDIVKYMIEDQNCIPVSLDFARNNGFHVAARKGHEHIMKYLWNIKKCDILERNEMFITPFGSCIIGGNVNVLKYMENELGCDLSQLLFPLGQTALHIAAQHGHLQLTRYLIEEKNADPNCRRFDNKTPFQIAIISGQHHVAAYLKTRMFQRHKDPFPYVHKTIQLTSLKSSQQGSSVKVKCTYCGDVTNKMKKCSACRDATYCSENCQKKDWKIHKLVCNNAGNPFSTFTHLIRDNCCAGCGNKLLNMDYTCVVCNNAKYCTKLCLKRDWKTHKKVCEGMKQISTDIKIVSDSLEPTLKKCGGCGKQKSSLRKCPCHRVAYCNTACQRADWSRHRATCISARKSSDSKTTKS